MDRIFRMYEGKKLKKEIQKRMREFRGSFNDEKGVDYKSMIFQVAMFIPFLLKRNYLPIVFCNRN